MRTPHKFPSTKPAALGAALCLLALAGTASAQDLNPPPPTYLDWTCTAVGSGTLCSASRVNVYGPQETDIVCGSGDSAFAVYDQGVEYQHVRRWYDTDGNLTRRLNHERFRPAWVSNPLTGTTLPYTQTNTYDTVLAVPGDLDSATVTTTGENITTDPETGKKIFIDVGRNIVGPDGTVEFTAGNQLFVSGDPAVFDPLCAALSS
jgi:hypothetical protein